MNVYKVSFRGVLSSVTDGAGDRSICKKHFNYVINTQRLVFMEHKYDHKTYSEGVYDTKSITFEYSILFECGGIHSSIYMIYMMQTTSVYKNVCHIQFKILISN